MNAEILYDATEIITKGLLAYKVSSSQRRTDMHNPAKGTVLKLQNSGATLSIALQSYLEAKAKDCRSLPYCTPRSGKVVFGGAYFFLNCFGTFSGLWFRA